MAPIPATRPGLSLTPGLACRPAWGAFAFSKAKLEMCFAAIVFWPQSRQCCYIWNFEAAPPLLDSSLLTCIRLPLQTLLCEFYFQPRWSLGARPQPSAFPVVAQPALFFLLLCSFVLWGEPWVRWGTVRWFTFWEAAKCTGLKQNQLWGLCCYIRFQQVLQRTRS